MVTPTGCPDVELLTAYAGNDLAFEEAVSLEEHFANCRACLDRFVELGKKSLTPDIPECHVVKEIGRGRFGVVYKAWRTGEAPQIVALKILNAPGEMEQGRFDREINVLQKLDSPGIVKCLDAGRAGDAHYYIMDFVEGAHLDDYLESHTESLEEKLRVFARVCRAVADAHAIHVVHRDLKPRNILIDDDGQPHILDFGICSVETMEWSSWDKITLTHPGDIIGTLKYMSPEQAWGGAAGAIDHHSDIWSLGIMLYEIVTNGGYPYSLEPGSDRPLHETVLERIRRDLPVLPKLNDKPRGRDLEILLERCLAWEPKQRIGSASELADDLERYIEGRRIKTKPLKLGYRLQRVAVGLASRSRTPFAIMFVGVAMLSLWVLGLACNVGWKIPMAGATGDSRDSILVAGVTDETFDSIVSFAREHQLEGVTSNVTSWRGVHGLFMNRLARTRARALVWDYFFRTPQQADDDFVSGVVAMETAGIPVVLAVHDYDEEGTPDLSPTISHALGRGLRQGSIAAREMIDRPGEFIIAVKRDAKFIVPSLALTTLGALLHPEARIDLEWPSRTKPLNLLFELEPGRYLRERGQVEPTKSYRSKIAQVSFVKGDLMAIAKMDLQRPDAWKKRTVPYERLLTMDDDELEDLVRGKVVLVGDLRAPRFGFRPDRHPVRYGQTVVQNVPGCYLKAESIAGLMDGRYLKLAIPPLPAEFLLMLAAALLAYVVPMRLARSKRFDVAHRRQITLGLCVVLGIASLMGMLLLTSYWSVQMSMAGYVVMLVMSGSFWVEFVRNRHRIAESGQRPNEHFEFSNAGTVTLPTKRS